jgi:hypothetical protein
VIAFGDRNQAKMHAKYGYDFSKDWEDIFPTVMVRRLPREVSDHNPLDLGNS